MPEVNQSEKHGKKGKNHYIARCVKVVMKEGKNQSQALGQCEGMYKEAKKRKHAKGHRGEDAEPNFDENETKIATIIPPIL